MDVGQVPTIVHCVIPIKKGVRLFHQPLQQFPETWRAFLSGINLNPLSSNATGKSTSKSSTFEKSSETKIPGCTNHFKMQEPYQDPTLKSSSISDTSQKKSYADAVNPCKNIVQRSEKCNITAKLTCATVCSDSSSKNLSTRSIDSKSSNKAYKRCASTEFIEKKSLNKSKCNGQFPPAINNAREDNNGCLHVKSNYNDKLDSSSIGLVGLTKSCNKSEKSVSMCNIQSFKATELEESVIHKKVNILYSDDQKTLKDMINKNKNFTNPVQIPVSAKKISLKSSRSPKKVRNPKKKVSFHLANLKIESAKCNGHEEKAKVQHHPPKVKFSVKFQDNTMRYRLKQTNCELVQKQTSSVTEFFKESGLGLLKNCGESAIENEVSDKSEDHNNRTKKCNSAVNSLISPNKTISHCPKPPSTVKLKKV